MSELDMLRIDDALRNKKVAVTYAYRYLLNREPESAQVVKWFEDQQLNWQELREIILQSPEYKSKDPTADMPYRSLKVEGITYFYNCMDRDIPEHMHRTGANWAKGDIDNFIAVADKMFYQKRAMLPPEEGLFLDIGGNIGTTSIYCKLKLKPRFRFIGFEPFSDNAMVFKLNTVVNGIEHDVKVEKMALTNEKSDHRIIAVLPENMGGSFVADPESAEELKQTGRIVEGISETTLDEYLSANQIS